MYTPGRRSLESLVRRGARRAGSSMRANVTKVSPIRSLCATNASATVTPGREDRNSMLRPLALTKVEVEVREDCGV